MPGLGLVTGKGQPSIGEIDGDEILRLNSHHRHNVSVQVRQQGREGSAPHGFPGTQRRGPYRKSTVLHSETRPGPGKSNLNTAQVSIQHSKKRGTGRGMSGSSLHIPPSTSINYQTRNPLCQESPNYAKPGGWIGRRQAGRQVGK